MTTKTKMPDGIKELLERVGLDTQTGRLCIAGDYLAALEWLRKVIRPDEWNPETKVGGKTAMGRQQVETNRLRAEAYSTLVALLETVVDG